MKALVSLSMLSFLASAALPLHAQAPARQDMAELRRVAEQFLSSQAAGLSGQVAVTVGSLDPRLNLVACPSPEAFFPGGARAWGKTTVGIRCSAPAAWTIYLAGQVRVTGDYVVAKVPLAQGKNIEEQDLGKATGELSALPPGVVTNASQALGRNLTVSLKAGAPLRTDILRNRQALQQGQTVKVTSGGPGFTVSIEARALTNAAEGQVAQAKTSNGQIISGVARAGGVLEVVY